jgi:PAS domain S-box-containing protein
MGPCFVEAESGHIRNGLSFDNLFHVMTESSVPTIDELQRSDQPFVLADHQGIVVSINPAFERVYGWRPEVLVGTSLGRILPESFLMSHQLGFSRFQASGSSTVLGHPLRLSTRCSDGSEIVSEHFILAEKRERGWVFGATLTPLPQGTEPDQ